MPYLSAKLLVFILGITTLMMPYPGKPGIVFGAEFRIGAVTTNVNLRKTPSLQGDIVAGLQKGSPVKVYGEKDGWYRISAKKNYIPFNGWVYQRYVEIATVSTEPTRPQTESPGPLPRALPEKSTPAAVTASPPLDPTVRTLPPVKQASVKPAQPEPSKTAVATPAKQEIAAEKTTAPASEKLKKQPPSTQKTPAPVASPQPSGNVRLLLSISPLLLAIIALLVAVRAFRVARAPAPAGKVEKPVSPPTKEPIPEKKATAEGPPVSEKRRAPRVNRLIEIDFAVDGKFFRGFINNLSETGVYVDTPEKFTVGQAITISCPAIDTGGYVKRVGLIVRLTETGIAVHFQQNEGP